ncbi:hypothetical protein CFE70_010159 [Pyrenophora teres f. teres 0-1]
MRAVDDGAQDPAQAAPKILASRNWSRHGRRNLGNVQNGRVIIPTQQNQVVDEITAMREEHVRWTANLGPKRKWIS